MVARNVVNQAALTRVSARITGIRQATAEASRRGVTVGIHEEEGAELDDSGATVAAIAAFHEFGTSRVPRRSWLLDGITENEAAISEAFRRVGREIAAKRLSPEAGYAQLGEFIVAKLQARIRANIPPPLSPVTIARKGSSTALIDEGRLIASIRAKVTLG